MTALQPTSTPIGYPRILRAEERVRVGRYLLCCELACGGMATIYLAIAEDSYVARPLAFKRIHPHLASDPAFVEMFIDEARIASRLNHPNLCGALDFGAADGTYYLTMEYLIGESLQRLIHGVSRRPQISGQRYARVMAQIIADACEGLHAAHQLTDEDGKPLHIVHRDVSPSNLFVTYEGPTRVLDFGIAAADDRCHHTGTGAVKGKFGYMAPEQFFQTDPDRRVDVWALGVVLWEALALRRLFRRDNIALSMAATLQGEVPALAGLVPSMDPALVQIITRALSSEREERYQTAAEMASELQAFLAATGAPNARQEVSALLREVFPEGEREKRALIKGARPYPPATEATPTRFAARERRSHSEIIRRRPSEGLGTQAQLRSVGLGILLGLGALMLGLIAAIATLSSESTRLSTSKIVVGPHAGASTTSGASVPTAPPSPNNPRGYDWKLTPLCHASDQPGAGAVQADARSPRAGTHEARAGQQGSVGRKEDAAQEPSADAVATPRPARTGTKAAPPARAGTISIVTRGDWARVYFRGRLLGLTPGRFTLPEGVHTLVLAPGAGGPSRQLRVTVSPGEPSRLKVAL